MQPFPGTALVNGMAFSADTACAQLLLWLTSTTARTLTIAGSSALLHHHHFLLFQSLTYEQVVVVSRTSKHLILQYVSVLTAEIAGCIWHENKFYGRASHNHVAVDGAVLNEPQLPLANGLVSVHSASVCFSRVYID